MVDSMRKNKPIMKLLDGKRNRIKKLAAGALAAALLLTGCGSTDGETEQPTESGVVKIPIIFTVDPTSGKKNNQELADAFNEAYAGKYYLDVEWVLETEEEYRQNLKRMNATDSLPAIIYDVCTVPSFYIMMVEEGRLEDLTPYIEADEEWKSMIEPAVLEGCTYTDGKIYLGPISTAAFTCSGMFWNEELFHKAGIESFPKTWEEFWVCCDMLTEAGITPLSLHTEGTGWAPMLIATAAVSQTQEGADFMHQMLPDTYLTGSGREIADILQKLFMYTTEDALHTDFDVAHSNFFSGKTAMLPNGYWMIEQLPEEWEGKVRFSSFPQNTLVASPETFGWAVVESYSDEVKEAAVTFLKFRTQYNKQEKETLFEQGGQDAPQALGDYLNAFLNAEQIVPNYQVKWNSILQEEMIGKGLPLLADGSITPEELVRMADESVREFKEEQ